MHRALRCPGGAPTLQFRYITFTGLFDALEELVLQRSDNVAAEREKAALHESLQSDRRAREAADRASQESKRALAAAEAARREVERERDHLRAQNDNQR